MCAFVQIFKPELCDIVIEKKIMELFEYLDMSADGQLCFTAHNLSPMSLLKRNKESINFISSINTVHTGANNGNQTPTRAYGNGCIEDSPFNVDASDFLGILGGDDE